MGSAAVEEGTEVESEAGRLSTSFETDFSLRFFVKQMPFLFDEINNAH